MELKDIKNKLNSVNWNFDFNINYSTESLYPFDCRKHYSYPATFIPEIPYTLIEILSNKGDIVLDPFGGIGTTFIQALLLERFPFSCDINPVATNVCEKIYDLLNPSLEHSDIKQQLIGLCADYDENYDYKNNISELQKELIGWYETQTFNKLCYLIHCHNNVENDFLKGILKYIISSILTTLSSQNKGWAYIADNVKPKMDEYKEKDVFEIYRSRVNVLFDDIRIHLQNTSSSFVEFYEKTLTEDRIFNTSVLNTPITEVDLIITSPPYPRMIDYVKSQRMSLGFLNKTFNEYVSQEIGARCRRSRKGTLEEYEDSMKHINCHLGKILKNNGFLCLILPEYAESDDRKKVIDQMVLSYEQYGLKLVQNFQRYIPSNRRTISIQWASLINEKIYVFRKEKSDEH